MGTATAQSTQIGGGKHADSYAEFPLAMAIKDGDNATVKALLGKVGPNAKQAGIPPLAVALQANNEEAARMILEHPGFKGINEFYTVTIGGSTPMTERYTAIVDAIESENPELMKMVLDKGATVDYLYETILETSPRLQESQQTPLTLAISRFGMYDPKKKKNIGNYKIEEQYRQIQRIADGTTNINRIMPIHNAPNGVGPGGKPYPGGVIATQPVSLFMILTRNNQHQDGNPANEYINKVLCSVADRVDLSYKYPTFSKDAIAQLKAAGVDAATIKAAQDAQKYAYVCNTWIYDNATLLKHVLDIGGKLDVGGDGGQFFFVQTYDIATLRLLVEQGFDINKPAYNGYRLIYGVVRYGEDITEVALRLGADPNLTLPDGSTNALSFTQGLAPKDRKKVQAVLRKYGAK